VRLPRPARREWILAVGLLVLAELEIAIGYSGTDAVVMAVAAVPACLGVAWRVVAPVEAFLSVATVYAVTVAAGVPTVEVLVLGGATTAVVTYSIGLHGRGFAERHGLAIVLATIGTVSFIQTPEVVGDLIFPPLVFGALPWLGGRTMRRRRRLAAALEETARQLELEREDRARAAVLDERVRIARELHDLVAHSVSTMVVQAGAARRMVRDRPGEARDAALAIEGTGREALGELRGLLGVLRRGDEELALAPQPTLQRIDALVEGARATGLEVDLRIEGDPGLLPRGEELAAYRIVQEALTNVMQHAGQARAEVVLRYLNDRLEIEVADDGIAPANGGPAHEGHGLVGMRERVALYGGTLEAGRAPDGGWSVRARLPRQSEVAA
jgi:signal transduction histidine kinase